MKTTVQVSVTTWQHLQSLRERPGESLDDVIARLIQREQRTASTRSGSSPAPQESH